MLCAPLTGMVGRDQVHSDRSKSLLLLELLLSRVTHPGSDPIDVSYRATANDSHGILEAAVHESNDESGLCCARSHG